MPTILTSRKSVKISPLNAFCLGSFLCITRKQFAISGQCLELCIRHLCLQSTVLRILAMKPFNLLMRNEWTGKVGRSVY